MENDSKTGSEADGNQMKNTSRENQVNLQLWVDKEFKDKLVKIANEAGYPRWQSYVETLLLLAVKSDIKLSPPSLVKDYSADE